MVQENSKISSSQNEDYSRLLEENERMKKELELVLWASNSSTWTWNYLTGHLDFSERKAKSVGYEKHEIESNYEAFTSKLHPDDYEMTMQAMVDLLSGKTDIYEATYRIQHKNGNYIWFHDKGRIISTQENGAPLLIEGVATEITEIKKLENDLGESKKQFMSFFYEAPDAYYLHKTDGTLVDANKRAEELTGIKKEQFIGVSLLETPLVDGDDRIKAEQIIKINSAGKNSGPHELKLNRADGSYVYVSIATQAITIAGESLVLGIARDISRRVETEQKLDEKTRQFETFFNSNPSATFVWKRENNDFLLFEVNASALQVSKNDAKNYIGKSATVIYAHVPQIIEKLNECYDTKSSLKFEAHYKSKSTGNYEWVDYKMVYQDESCVLMYTEIITGRKTAEQKLIDSEARSKALLGVIPDLMFRLDSNGVIIDYKADKKDLYAQDIEELRGIVIMEYLPPEIAEMTSYYIDKTLSENEIQYYTYQLEVPHSGLHYYEARMIPSGKQEVTAIVRDVTDREETLNRLIESEARSSALLNAIPDLMFRLSKDGVYLDYSAPVSELAVQDETIIGKNIKDLLPSDIANKSLALIADALELGVVQSFDYELFIPGKGLSFYEARIMPTINDEVLTIVRNITERKLNEKALAESEEKFRLIAENTSDALFIFDGKTQRINYVSPSIKNITGYSAEEENGKGSDEIYQMIHPDDRKVIFDRIFEAIENKQDSLVYTYRMFHKNGNIIWRQDSTRFIYDEFGEFIRSYVVARDITKQKEEELELIMLRTAIEQSSVGVVITDLAGKIEYVNPGLHKMTGYTNEELLGQNPRILSAGTNSAEFYENLWNTIKGGDNWAGEFHNKRKNGELYRENSVISPIKNDKGDITHFVGIKEDITEFRRLLQELKLAKEKAEQSDRLKSAFLTNMSHEIRTPMNAVVGFSTLVSSKKLSDDKLARYSKLISQNASQLLYVLNDILDISKIEANQVELFFTEMDINQELSDIYHIADSMLEEKKPKVNLKINIGIDKIIIKTDIVRFRQIMLNLISNAIKFTSSGHIKFGYKLHDNKLIFFVKDTGLGIPADMHDSIFERFQQAKHRNGAFFGGTGLGLSIAKTYTEMLGGSIWLESEEGKGTTFFFTLPLKV